MPTITLYAHQMDWVQIGPSYQDWGNELFGRVFNSYYARLLSIPVYDIPHDSTINSATISFVSGGQNSGTCKVRVTAEDTNDPQPIISRADYLTRVHTTNSVLYDAPTWNLGQEYSFSILTPLREVTNRNGWTAGNRMNVFFITEEGVSGVYRWPEGPTLTVNYTPLFVEPHQVREVITVSGTAGAVHVVAQEGLADETILLADAVEIEKASQDGLTEESATVSDAAAGTLEAFASAADPIALLDGVEATRLTLEIEAAFPIGLADQVEISRLQEAVAADPLSLADAMAAVNITDWFRINGHRARKSYRLTLAGNVIPFRDLHFTSESGQAAMVRVAVIDEAAFPAIIQNPAGRLRLEVFYQAADATLSEVIFDLPFADCYFVSGGAVELLGIEETPASGKVIGVASIAERHIANRKTRIVLPEPNMLARAGDRIQGPNGIDFQAGRVSITIGPHLDRMDITEG